MICSATYTLNEECKLGSPNIIGWMNLHTSNGQNLFIHKEHPQIAEVRAALQRNAIPLTVMVSVVVTRGHLCKNIIGITEKKAGLLNFSGIPLIMTENRETSDCYDMKLLFPTETGCFQKALINGIRLDQQQMDFFRKECNVNRELVQQWQEEHCQKKDVFFRLNHKQIWIKLESISDNLEIFFLKSRKNFLSKNIIKFFANSDFFNILDVQWHHSFSFEHFSNEDETKELESIMQTEIFKP